MLCKREQCYCIAVHFWIGPTWLVSSDKHIHPIVSLGKELLSCEVFDNFKFQLDCVIKTLLCPRRLLTYYHIHFFGLTKTISAAFLQQSLLQQQQQISGCNQKLGRRYIYSSSDDCSISFFYPLACINHSFRAV